MGNSGTKEQSLRPHVKRTATDKPPRSVVIMGATGATGKFILSYLICSKEWSKITIIHRREVDLDEISKKSNITFTDQQKSKVTQHVIDMEKLCENEETISKNVELFKNHDVTICVLGTTRAVAKSAENFRKVDLYMVRDGGILSQKAGIKHFSLLTSANANANLWTNDWKISHGLLYLKTKGDAEQSIIQQKFSKTSIFRPGWLDREGVGGSMKLSVRDLAAVIVYDAESEYNNEEDEKKVKEVDDGVIIYESGDIDNMLVLARNNFNAACTVDGVVESKKDDDAKENVENINEQVVDDHEKVDEQVVVKEDNLEKNINEQVVEEKKVDEVVVDEKVEAADVKKVEDKGQDGDVVKDEDYVKVDKQDVNKDVDKDGDGQ